MGCQADRYYGLEQALVQVLAQVLHRRTCAAACNYCNLCCIRSPMLLPVSCAVSWPALTLVLQSLNSRRLMAALKYRFAPSLTTNLHWSSWR